MPDSEPIDLLLVIALQYPCEDYYFPESAAYLIEGLRNLDNHALAVTVELWALEAEAEMSVN